MRYLVNLKVVLALFFCGATSAYSEDFQGLVRMVGSAASATTVLTDKDGKQLVNFCKSDLSRRVSRLTGMTVKGVGDWQEATANKIRCLQLTSFDVVKVSSGRNAVVGILAEKDGDYMVTAVNGATRVLARVPKGLRKMLGKKVIIDVKPMGSPSTKKESWKVVTYAPYP